MIIIYIEQRVLNVNNYVIYVKNIQPDQLIRKKEYYVLKIVSELLNIRLKISLNNNKYLARGRLSGRMFSFRREGEFYTLRIKIQIDKMMKNRGLAFHRINYNVRPGVNVFGFVKVNYEYIEREKEEIEKQNQLKHQKKLKRREELKRKHENKMKKHREIAERMEEIHVGSNVNNPSGHSSGHSMESIDENTLRKKGIKYVGEDEKRTCNDCTYYIGKKCSYHQVETTPSYSCFNYRPYRVYQGGGVSPK